ncbi:MAG: toprim domain-containing protein, partial [Candidatus Woesearchaeota archaeon]|nr:toprim domain-containing protein [Candidatus Woesearchaeota archaeon]
MSTILIVAEKPSSAQKIASALGSTVKKAGYFETKYGKDTILVAPAVGHLFSLNLKEKTSAYPVFDIHWVPASDTGADYSKKYADVLRRVAKDCDSVVNACDFDIEGSLIGYNVIRFLVPKGTPSKRMQFSTLTKDELQQAFEQATELDTNNALAGEARHILDWYYGINLSR